jgi:hypothetical protein
MSSNMSKGIQFGNLTSLPVSYVNATGNWAGINATPDNRTQYNVTVSYDSNVNVDFCVNGSTLATTGGATIGSANYTWADSKSNNATDPWPAPGNHTISASYVAGMKNVAPGSAIFYRFWLNVSAATTPGVYNNTVYFQGVPTGDTCS